jgi:uncharacterized membrane protein YraQ (UPF0718 family)
MGFCDPVGRMLDRHPEGILATQTAAFAPGISFAGATSRKSRVLALVLLLSIGAYFWTVSRYPALYKKYSQGTNIKVTGAITFGTVYAVDRTMPLAQRVGRTTVNWLQANEIGMTFGFFFGAAALAFLATLPRRRSQNRYVNALIGAVTGAPLGVCANCVVPIARGLYASGMSTESVLAAMFSSPGLNVIVLAMAFALFPLPVFALKTATVLFLIFVVAPAVASMNGARECQPEMAGSTILVSENETWGGAFRSTAKSFVKSFWYVFKIGAPLMVLAALLGALAIELLPQGWLISQGTIVPVTLLGILLVAVIGAFLPVPMAFDVVIAYVAMTHGVPLPYVVTLLCTLGIYSVYSFAVLGKTISWKAGATVYGAVVALGVAAGVATRLLG